MLTPDQIQTIKSGGSQSNVSSVMTPEQAKSSFAPTQVEKPSSPGIADQILNASQGGVNKIKEGMAQSQQASKEINPIKQIESGLKVGAGMVDTAFAPLAPITPLISKASDLIVPFSSYFTSGKALNDATSAISSNPSVQKFANSKAGEATIRGAEDVSNLATMGQGVLGVMGGEKVPNALEKIPLKPETIKAPMETPKLNEGFILDKYNRAIKPTVSGKSNASQVVSSNTKVIDGLKSIANNKENLSFTDRDGQVVQGKTPESVDQLSQSIEQTKKSIFNQYDTLAKQAGEQGIKVDTSKVANELKPVITSKSLAIANPKAVEYAKNVFDRLNSVGGIDATVAQDVIQHYNESLKAFYRNPSYETASQASIDAMLANKFRQLLDEGISGATGEQYQELKNQYGALSSMEKDVAHRNIVWGRQNKVGLASSMANMASGAELLRGLVTMNPADIAISGSVKAIDLYNKYLNNPDVGVRKIFDELNTAQPSPKANIPQVVEPNKVNNSSTNSTIDKSIPQEKGKPMEMGTYKLEKSPTGRVIDTKFKNPKQNFYPEEPASEKLKASRIKNIIDYKKEGNRAKTAKKLGFD